jgi:endo-1,4-beta-D-glucanase Y
MQVDELVVPSEEEDGHMILKKEPKGIKSSNWVVDPNYIAFPTLRGLECSIGASYKWRCAPRAADFLFNRFMCES